MAILAGRPLAASSPYCGYCHEMKPYVAQWASGLHSAVECNQCHTDPGLRGLIATQFEGLRKILIHIFRRADLARVRASVPGRRCAACHDMADRGRHGDRVVDYHVNHRKRNQDCIACHAVVGHTRQAVGDLGQANCKPCHLVSAQEKLSAYMNKGPDAGWAVY